MTNLQEIKAAIESQNPFAKPPFAGAKDVWGNDFFDVETINAHASEAVFKALEQIRAGQYSTTSIAIIAQDGTGKTHIISRIYHRLQSQGGAWFIYVNKYSVQNMERDFQINLADSLKNLGSNQVPQWQELATAMANDALKYAKKSTFSAKGLAETFQKRKPAQVKKFVNDFTNVFCRIKSVNNPDVVRAIFWTLSEEQILYAVNWLAGKEIAQFKADELGLPTQNQSFEAVLQILDLISEYNELVICFDELDDPDKYNETNGLHISQIVASFIKNLLQNLNRGVILSVMMPAQWNNKVKQLPGGVYNKVSAYGSPIDLKYMDGDSIIALVKFWLSEYYKNRNLLPPAPVYPFQESQLRELGSGKPTIREVLQWCRDNCNPSAEPPNPVEVAFAKELEEDLGSALDDNYLIANALLFSFQRLIGQTVERVTIEDVTDKVRNRRKDNHINFKVIGKESGQNVSIGVGVLQQASGKSLGPGLKKLNDYQAFGLTRGCLVRSKSKKITPHVEKTYIIPLVKQKGGEVVPLKEEEVKPLIAIHAVYQKRDVDYKVSDLQIFNFIAEKGGEKMLGTNNPLLQEILSDPSYEVPSEMIEEEPVVLEEAQAADVSDSDSIEEGIDNLLSQINQG